MAYPLTESEIMHPPFSMVYNQHAAEIPCQALFGDPDDCDWETALDGMMQDGADGFGDYVAIPAGWRYAGWENHAHKDALWLVSVYLEPDGGECRICADALI